MENIVLFVFSVCMNPIWISSSRQCVVKKCKGSFLFSLVNPLDVGVVNLTLRGFCSDEMEVMGLD